MNAVQRLVRGIARRAVGWNSDFERLIINAGRTIPGGTSAVDAETSLKLAAHLACVRILSEAVGMCPCILYRYDGDGNRERAKDDPRYTLFHDAPNDEMTAMTLFETLTFYLATRGNGFWENEQSQLLATKAIWPIETPRVYGPRRVAGSLSYDVTMDQGPPVTMSPPRIVHFRGLSPNGFVGHDYLALISDSLSYAMSVRKSALQFFENDMSPLTGYFSTEQPYNERAYKRYIRQLKKQQREHRHETPILYGGLKYNASGVDPEKAQLATIQTLTIRDIARVHRVPPHMIAEMEHATFSNIEHQSLEFVIYTLLPTLRRIEQQIRLTVLGVRSPFFTEFLVDELLRGDIRTRFEAYRMARQDAWMDADEIRARENLPPLRDGKGKIILQPVNMVELGTLPATPKPAESEAGGGDTDKASGGRVASDADGGEPGPPSGRRSLDTALSGLVEESYRRIARREADRLRQIAGRIDGAGDWTHEVQALYESDIRAYAAKQLGPVLNCVLASAGLDPVSPEARESGIAWEAAGSYASAGAAGLIERIGANGGDVEKIIESFAETRATPEAIKVAQAETSRLLALARKGS